jgi:hypothetical protein
MHPTLTPKNNLRLLAVWAVACVATAVFFMRPMLWLFFIAGAALGGIAGFLQLRALRQSGPQLIVADSAMGVRRALQTTRWGKTYLAVFWLGNVAIVVLSVLVYREGMIGGWIAGYCSFSLLRGIITLSGTYELQRLEGMAAGRAA